MHFERLESGTRFGPYAVEGFIAAGGMGEVYAAREAVYGTPVALKVLHAELHAEASWRRRFNEEGLVGQTLKHPNVVAARDLVEVDGRVALVMDLVRGSQTLKKLMEREMADGVPLVAGLQLFLGILQGVEYAHGKGIVHGDLKPENVLIRGDVRDVSTWLALVTDFGTVGLLANPILIDGQPAVVASPRYASPEHLRGIAHLSVRSDVYSLGLLLHFLLTGRHVSDARNVVEAAERVSRPIPLSHLANLPAGVVDVIRRATAIRIEDRYASCRDLALPIRQVLDGLGVRLDLDDLSAELATEVLEDRGAPPFWSDDEEPNSEAETELLVEARPPPTRPEAGIPLLTAPVTPPPLSAAAPATPSLSPVHEPPLPVEAPPPERLSPAAIVAGALAIVVMAIVVVYLTGG